MSWQPLVLAAALATATATAPATPETPAEMPAGAPADPGWRTDVVDGCEVSTRAVAGRVYVAARAVCLVPGGIDAVAAVLADVERYPEWVKDCTQARVLQVVDRDRDVYVLWYRQHVTLFADRDMVLRSERVHGDARRRVIRASSTSALPFDPGKGYVRMPAFSSEWVLEAAGAGQTRVSFTIEPDLGPGLPVGLANATIRATPLASLQALARRLPGQGTRGP